MNERQELMEMLTYRRPAGSKAERKFIRRFIKPLDVMQDEAGNLIKRIGDAPVLWSCHTDTVHRAGGRQLIVEKNGIITAPKSSCLGADDTAGVWLMVQMIRANVPGLYVFHRAEEIGGYGSMHIAHANRELLLGINYAIALDRRGKDSIVTEQWGGRCCSDAFANALADGLRLPMKPDPTGTFTDTANYMEIVPECTNISVGYDRQHTPNESLDTAFLFKLLDALCLLDVESLPVIRTPLPVGSDWSTATDNADQEPLDVYFESNMPGWNSHGLDRFDALRDVIRYYPEAVADFLDQYGVSADDILQSAGIETRLRA